MKSETMKEKKELTPKQMILETYRAVIGDEIMGQLGLIHRVARMERRWMLLMAICIALGAVAATSLFGIQGTIKMFFEHLASK
jgi:hypothetical protein